jgi:hypothetical protein
LSHGINVNPSNYAIGNCEKNAVDEYGF